MYIYIYIRIHICTYIYIYIYKSHNEALPHGRQGDLPLAPGDGLQHNNYSILEMVIYTIILTI